MLRCCVLFFPLSEILAGNWYQRLDNNEIGLQDYQVLARGHFSRDIAYLLTSSPRPEDRRVWEKELIRFYLGEFEKAGGPKIPEKKAWFEIRLQIFAALAYWTLTLTSVVLRFPKLCWFFLSDVLFQAFV
jgi:hypothetical protein